MRKWKIGIRGPLAADLPAVCAALESRGYTRLSIRNLARLLAHLSRWLADHQLGAGDLTRETIDRFVRARRAAGYTGHRCASSLEPLLEYLRAVGTAPRLAPLPRISTPNDATLDAYRTYLTRERDLAPATARFYLHVAQAVLPGDGDLTRLTAHTVTRSILDLSHRYSVAYTKYWVSAVRGLLRYLFAHGKITTDLIGAIPAVAGWRLTGIPQDLDPAVVAEIVRACDGRTHEGRRTRAVVLLMVRLGLRVGEVAALRLDDVDWRAGEIVIRGKGRRTDRLPLPVDVGAAVAAYVRRSRPRTESRRLFLRVHAPHRPTGSSALKSAVRAACRRAGVPEIGTHRLRHTAASQMLRRGSSLAEIAQVLRHRHLDTTAIYAKVDRVALRDVARPWPGGAR
jgi:site-specific recombinase XerD